MAHLALHFIVPLLVAFLFFSENLKLSYLVMMLTMLVDLDHLLASTIYDANRCSIGFHPLHQYWFIAIYLVMSFFSKTRLIGVGLIIHMSLDALDCF
ncbi:DUF6122 family protein [Gammaproteobacteria bacterium]|nr:DUF6122 family protein [Gammaproteobacteria bacterium]MDA8614092.1 DUF6122 family protein [Gammaproteobacteria bacterium]MDA8655377.1 DUF6122 family protein [Gammaproteobacteria bacterium]MDA8840383.1 DUF6122 family protein [Gammaproteobacteria bacterium]MDA9141171.1 DUF6122 family protein [Gammaproteobacteria bacterium]